MPDRRPGPAHALPKAINRIKARGAGEVGALLLERVTQAIRSDDELIVLVRPTGGPRPSASGLEFREATETDAVDYSRDIGTDSARTFAARLSESTRCFIVRDGDLVVHATWMTTLGAWTRELRAYLRPPQGEAYVYESFTRAAARGRGVYPFALGEIAAWLEDRGVGRVWVAVEGNNPPSLKAVTKAGFEESFRIPYRRRLGRLTIDPPEGPDPGAGAGWMGESPAR
jgi:GNAT superfamily N-acetyltransferase